MAVVHSVTGEALPGAQIAAAIARFRSAPPMPRERRKAGPETKNKFWWEKDPNEHSKHDQIGAKPLDEAKLPAWLTAPLPAAVTMSGNPLEHEETPFRPNYGVLNSSTNSIAPPPPSYPPASHIPATSPAAQPGLDSTSKSTAARRR